MSLKAITFSFFGLVCGYLHAASVTVHLTDQKEQAVKGAVLQLLPESHQPAFTRQHAVIDQINKEYVPRVVVVQQGGTVSFPNKDDIKHHVYSFSPAKQFELPLYEGTPTDPVIFNKPGVVVLGCNIHDWMRGYIFVAETPYVAKSGDSGEIALTNLPPDTYQLTIWHPQLKQAPSLDSIQLQQVSSESINISLQLKPLIKIRRNQTLRRRGYD